MTGGEDRDRWRDDVTSTADRDARGDLLDAMAARAATGDLRALDDLLWAVDHLALGRPAIRRLVLGEDDAEDVEQDLLIAVAESVHSFRGESRFSTWVHALARRKAVDALRRRRPTSSLPPDLGDAARISSMIATRTTLDGAIAGLPDLYRDAVVLRDMQGHEYAEVADRLGLGLNTTRTRIARGRALVAAQLRDRG